MENIRGVGNFIVKVENPYKEEYDVKGIDGKNLARDHRWNDFDNANKFGTVISTIEGSGVPVGATLYFHHCIVEWRERNAGGELYCIDKEKSLYRVPYKPLGYPDPLHNKAYAWEKDGHIESINDWILLEQEKVELETTKSGLVIVSKIEDVIYSSGEAAPKLQYSRVKYLNDYFRSLGFNEGDLLITRKDVEYPIKIGDKTYWRVWEEHLLSRVDE